MKLFKNPDKNFVKGSFKSAPRPKSPSPKRKDFLKIAHTKPDRNTKCGYIHPKNGNRCILKLGMYPRYCELHTMLIDNVYISKSNISGGGNGLFVGPYGFKKGDIIGIYSHSWNRVDLGTLEERCKNNNKCWSYTFCEHGYNRKTKCWDGLDIKSTIIRNINDARGSKFRNNSYFEIIDNKVCAIASRNIKPHREIYINYGNLYW
jgi:hypothetical protein